MLFGRIKVLQLQFTIAIDKQTKKLRLFLRVPFPPPFEIGPFFQDFGIGLNFQFNLNISEGEENAGAIQSVPADRGIIISKIILKT